MGVSMNSLRVENFLIFYNIRCGALIILWSVMLLFPYTLIVVSSVLVNVFDVIFFILTIVLFVGEVMAVLTLIYFPAPNKTYSPDSKTAKYLKYFAWYLCFTIVILVVLFFYVTFEMCFYNIPSVLRYLTSNAYSSNDNFISNYLYYFLSVCIALPFLLIGAVVHLMAVIYTFHLSILPNNNLDEIHNDVNISDNDQISQVVAKIVELV